MTAMDIDDLVVVTGPLKLPRFTIEESHVYLIPGEVGAIESLDEYGVPLVYGFESDVAYWIDPESLTPLSEYHADDSEFVMWSDEDQAYWGDLIDIDLSAIHDYVHEESE